MAPIYQGEFRLKVYGLGTLTPRLIFTDISSVPGGQVAEIGIM